jgi:hypothetical protein
MGTSFSMSPIVFDTGSKWLAVMGSQCSTCNSAYQLPYLYKYSSNVGNSFTQTSTSTDTINYSRGSLSGFYATDKVCLSASSTTCTPNFRFMLATAQTLMMPNTVGIAGMNTDSDGTGPSLIKSMKSSGVITKAAFCFYLTSPTSTSYLDIGIIDNTAMKDYTNLIMQNIIPGNYWWSNYVEGIQFGTSTSDSWGLDSTIGITDSGSSCLNVPPKYYDWVLARLQEKGLSFARKSDELLYLNDCNNNVMIDIKILMGGYWY